MQSKYGFIYTLRGGGGWLGLAIIIQLLNLARMGLGLSLAILQSIKLFHTCKTVIAEWGAKRVLAVGSSLFLRPSSKIFVAPKWLRILPEIHLCHRFQLQFTTGATWLNFFVHKEHTQHNITHAQNQLFVVLFSNPISLVAILYFAGGEVFQAVRSCSQWASAPSATGLVYPKPTAQK